MDSRELARATWPRRVGGWCKRAPGAFLARPGSRGHWLSVPSLTRPPASICCLLPPTPSRCLFFFQNIRLPPRQASKGGVPETPTLHTLMSLQLGGGGDGPNCALRRDCKVGGVCVPSRPGCSVPFCPQLHLFPFVLWRSHNDVVNLEQGRPQATVRCPW